VVPGPQQTFKQEVEGLRHIHGEDDVFRCRDVEEGSDFFPGFPHHLLGLGEIGEGAAVHAPAHFIEAALHRAAHPGALG